MALGCTWTASFKKPLHLRTDSVHRQLSHATIHSTRRASKCRLSVREPLERNQQNVRTDSESSESCCHSTEL